MSEPKPAALVLCGGLGTRLRPAIGDLPKALAPVGGQPFLAYLLRYLAGEDIRDIVLCTGVGGNAIEEFAGDGARWGARIRVSREPAPLGTGGALIHAKDLVHAQRFFALNGDSFVQANLADVERDHREREATITMVLTDVEDQSRFGSVKVAADGSVIGFVEKGASGPGLINAGIYLIETSVLDVFPAGVVSLEKDVLPRYVGDGLRGTIVRAPFIDIGTPESFVLATGVLPKEWQSCPS